MFTGKVTNRFRDKLSKNKKRYEVGDEYSDKDEKRLRELTKLGFVEFKAAGDKNQKQSEE